MDNTTNYFEAWRKAQEAWFGGFAEQAKRTQDLFLNQQNPAFPGNGMQQLYSAWSNAVLDSLAAGGRDPTVKDNLGKLLGGSNAYMKLYAIWQPLLKTMQEKTLTPDLYGKLVNPAEYRDLLDKVFGFDPEAARLMMEQATRLLELSTGSAQQFTKPWAEATSASLNALPRFAEGHTESFITILHSLFNAFENSVGKVFHVPPVGKDREKLELLLRGIDDLTVYAAKATEYQHVMYVTGMAAMEKVIEKLAEKVRSGEEIKQFDEFFDIWIDVSEQSYFNLFQTEEFAKLQGELLDSALNVKMRFAKIMELSLYSYPVALRSEMDDLYKTVHALKKRVRELEKQAQESAA